MTDFINKTQEGHNPLDQGKKDIAEIFAANKKLINEITFISTFVQSYKPEECNLPNQNVFLHQQWDKTFCVTKQKTKLKVKLVANFIVKDVRECINPTTNKPYKTLKKSFHKVLEKACIKNFRFHDLRHTVATRLVTKGIDITVVQEILGHSKITTTQRYAHPVPQRKLDAINILSNYLS